MAAQAPAKPPLHAEVAEHRGDCSAFFRAFRVSCIGVARSGA